MNKILIILLLICHSAMAQRIMPQWLSSKTSAIIKIDEVKPNEKINKITFTPIKILSGKLKMEQFQIDVPYEPLGEFLRDNSNIDLWSYKPPKKGDEFIVRPTERASLQNWDSIASFSKRLINEKEKRDILFIKSQEGETDMAKVANDLSKYLKGINSTSSYFWPYYQYLTDNHPDTVSVIIPALVGITADYDDIVQIGSIMSDLGSGKELTDYQRAVGVMFLLKYLSQKDSKKVIEEDDVSWVLKYKGPAVFDESVKKYITKLKGEAQKNSHLVPKQAYLNLMEMAN